MRASKSRVAQYIQHRVREALLRRAEDAYDAPQGRPVRPWVVVFDSPPELDPRRTLENFHRAFQSPGMLFALHSESDDTVTGYSVGVGTEYGETLIAHIQSRQPEWDLKRRIQEIARTLGITVRRLSKERRRVQ